VAALLLAATLLVAARLVVLLPLVVAPAVGDGLAPLLGAVGVGLAPPHACISASAAKPSVPAPRRRRKARRPWRRMVESGCDVIWLLLLVVVNRQAPASFK
jgi:hypothetical protein